MALLFVSCNFPSPKRAVLNCCHFGILSMNPSSLVLKCLKRGRECIFKPFPTFLC